jgi:general secretion pathway protein G
MVKGNCLEVRGKWRNEMHKSHRVRLTGTVDGFTLIEVMVVVVILGILAAIIVPKIMSRPEQARMVKVKQDITAIQSALDLYKLDNGVYPSTEQGLQALVSQPTSPPVPRSWNPDGYLHQLPVDPWGQAYQYENHGNNVRIYSFGPSGKEGGKVIDNTNIGS